MKIGLIADTHLFHRAVPLPRIVWDIFSGVDHIIHAGDITGQDVIPALERLAPVTAVAGNLDSAAVRDRYGEKTVVHAGGFSIGVCHGHGEKGSTLDRAVGCFQDARVDCIVYGHSHIPYIGYHGGIWIVNPGSPTDKRRNRFFSVGMLDIDEGISPRLMYFDTGGAVVNTQCGAIPDA